MVRSREPWSNADGRLEARLQLADVDATGALPVPADSKIILEIGANSRNTADQELLRHDPTAFVVSFEPLLDKWGTLMSRNSRPDTRSPLGFHHTRGMVLPFVVSPNAGQAELKISGSMDGCASLLGPKRGGYFSSSCTNKSGGVLERRVVPAVTLQEVLERWLGGRDVTFAKIDAQGLDVPILRSAGAAIRLIKAVQVEVVRDRKPIPCPVMYEGGEGAKCPRLVESMAELGFQPFGTNCTVQTFTGAHGCEADMTFVRRGEFDKRAVRAFCTAEKPHSCGPDLQTSAMPPTAFIYPLPPQLTMAHLYDTISTDSHDAQFLGELNFWRWLERYPHKSAPANADMLFVPSMLVAAYFALHRTEDGRRQMHTLTRAIEAFLETYSEWHTRRRAHAVVALRCGQEGHTSNALRATERSRGAWPSLWDSNATLLCVEPVSRHYRGRGVLLPYHVRQPCQAQLPTEPPPRSRLLFFSGSARAHASRPAWIVAMRTLPALAEALVINNRTSFDYGAIRRGYASSAFALCPPGHTGVRKGVFDALACGALPLFTSEWSPLPFAPLGAVRWSEFSLRVPFDASPAGVLHRLEAWVDSTEGRVWLRTARMSAAAAASSLDYARDAGSAVLEEFVAWQADPPDARLLKLTAATTVPISQQLLLDKGFTPPRRVALARRVTPGWQPTAAASPGGKMGGPVGNTPRGQAPTSVPMSAVPVIRAALGSSIRAALGSSARRSTHETLMATPGFLADEDHALLCDAKPPYGLRSDAGQIADGIRAGLNLSVFNASRNVSELCLQLARVLAQRTAGWRGDLAAGPPYRSCAVVGSGGGLRGSGHGRRIDSADAVLRFNAAPIDGYAADVGSRTTFVIGSHFPWRAAVRRDAQEGQRRRRASPGGPGPHFVLYCFNAWLGTCFIDALRHSFTPFPLMANPVLARHLQAAIKQRGAVGRSVRPSTGLLGIGLALSLCSHRIEVFGFGNATDEGQAAICGHYWDDAGRCHNQTRYFSGKMGNHDWHAQWRVVSDLVEEGALMYVRATAS